MTKLIAGLDEIATETHKADDWCYFCIPQTEYVKFDAEVKTLLAGTGENWRFPNTDYYVVRLN